MEKLRCKFTYFKCSGKFYTNAEGVIPTEQWLATRETIRLVNDGMPGLSGDGSEFFILLDPPEGYPMLIHPHQE
jgi:hypothetical protein